MCCSCPHKCYRTQPGDRSVTRRALALFIHSVCVTHCFQNLFSGKQAEVNQTVSLHDCMGSSPVLFCAGCINEAVPSHGPPGVHPLSCAAYVWSYLLSLCLLFFGCRPGDTIINTTFRPMRKNRHMQTAEIRQRDTISTGPSQIRGGIQLRYSSRIFVISIFC